MSTATPIPRRYRYISADQGGQGQVVTCFDENLQRNVAIKYFSDPNQNHRVLDEIRALQSVSSKHVVQLYDVIQDASLGTGIVLEYIDGSLLSELDLPLLTDLEALKILYQIGCGIADIHGHGFIHRDIKPKNIKRDSELVVKIFDFGLSRRTGIDDQTVGFRGSRGFAAPELYQSGPVAFTPAIDVYAYGVMAWCLLTKSDSLPAELLRLPPVVPNANLGTACAYEKEITEVIDRCLLREPTARPLMSEVTTIIAKYLVRNQHRGNVVHNNRSIEISATRKTANITGSTGSFDITYDGVNFSLQNVTGEVFINNQSVVNGFLLPGSCVITLGRPDRGAARRFVTFDISHPAVVI